MFHVRTQKNLYTVHNGRIYHSADHNLFESGAMYRPGFYKPVPGFHWVFQACTETEGYKIIRTSVVESVEHCSVTE